MDDFVPLGLTFSTEQEGGGAGGGRGDFFFALFYFSSCKKCYQVHVEMLTALSITIFLTSRAFIKCQGCSPYLHWLPVLVFEFEYHSEPCPSEISQVP